MKKELENYKVITNIPVQWADMDAARHVYNLMYMRWAEAGRLLYFEKMKMDTSFSGHQGPILGWQDCKYIYPMTYPDTAIVGARLLEIRKDRLVIECAVFSQKHKRITALSRQEIIPYDYIDLKKIPLPNTWLEAIKKIENP